LVAIDLCSLTMGDDMRAFGGPPSGLKFHFVDGFGDT
jgi:hypothetical protein